MGPGSPTTSSGSDDGEVVVDITDGTADELLDVLADDASRELLDRLRDGPATAAELSAATGLDRAVVEEHLRDLRDAELVAVETRVEEGDGETTPVYAPTDGAVIRYGEGGPATRTGPAVRLLAGVVGVALAAAVVELVFAGEWAGLLFFLGGTTALVAWFAYRYGL